jgi:hypothetical protein
LSMMTFFDPHSGQESLEDCSVFTIILLHFSLRDYLRNIPITTGIGFRDP